MNRNIQSHSNSSKSNIHFRIAIVGSHRARVAKVVSILLSEVPTLVNVDGNANVDVNSNSSSNVDVDVDVNTNVDVEYIPCVATFDSYENETGQQVKYLVKLEHHELSNDTTNSSHGNDGSVSANVRTIQMRGSSLAPLFDEMYQTDNDTDTNDNNRHNTTHRTNDKDTTMVIPGIAAVAIGCGIETTEEVQMISSFLSTLSSNSNTNIVIDNGDGNNNDSNIDIDNNNDNAQSMIVKCIQPNKEYKSMAEENKIYKHLDAQGKQQATEQQSMGPGKMAKFVNSLSQRIVQQYSNCKSNSNQATTALMEGVDVDPYDNGNNDTNCNDSTKPASHDCDVRESGEGNSDTTVEEHPIQNDKHDYDYEYDTTVTRFACKICRSVLFSQNELEDPPHTKAQHEFTSYKSSRSASRSKCQSVFLQSGLDWMGDISASMEGKILCFKCRNKLGMWKWAGGQCSCGTWVTPAIQVHLSRVDVIPPKDDSISTEENALPISPLAALHVAGARQQT